MKPKGKLGIAATMAVVASTSIAMISVGTASASGGLTHACGGCGTAPGGGGGAPGGGGGAPGGGGPGGGGGGAPGGGGPGGGGAGGGGAAGGGAVVTASVLTVTDNCGGSLKFKETSATPGTLSLTLTEFDVTTTDTWSLQATQQEYDATTGGRVGDPISLAPSPMGPPTYSIADGAYTTSADIADTVNMTHGISYTATRASDGLACTAQGYWTDHNGSTTPDPLNPSGKPDTAPALTGKNVATSGTNTVTIGFDQEMLDSAQGTPDISRFRASIGTVSVPVTAVQVTDSAPPGSAAVTLTLGSPLQAGDTVSLQYQEPLLNTDPALQDLDALETASFAVDIPVS